MKRMITAAALVLALAAPAVAGGNKFTEEIERRARAGAEQGVPITPDFGTQETRPQPPACGFVRVPLEARGQIVYAYLHVRTIDMYMVSQDGDVSFTVRGGSDTNAGRVHGMTPAEFKAAIEEAQACLSLPWTWKWFGG